MKRQIFAVFRVLLFLALLTSGALGEISFIEPKVFPLVFSQEGSVTGLTKGDFNGDGSTDIAATYSDRGIGLVGVFVGEGNGRFRSPLTIQLPAGAHNTFGAGITSEDFDSDGKPDLTVSATDNNGLNRVLFFRGRGDGTFYPFKASALPSPASPSHLRTADLDGNGTPDLVVLDPGGNAVSVLIGKGDGTFYPHVDYPVGADPSDMVLRDINNDGRPDVFAGSYGAKNFTVLLNNGNGTFSSAQFSAGMQVTGIFPGDFNNDGKTDFVAAGTAPDIAGAGCYTDCLLFLPGKGNGVFDPPSAADFSDGGPWPHAGMNRKEPIDINGDGNADFIFPLSANYNGGSNQVLAGIGKGDGTFTRKMWVASPGTTGWRSTQVDGGNPLAVEWGDFNADGRMDLIVAEGSNNTRNGGLSFLTGGVNGNFMAPRVHRLGRPLSSTTRSLALGDFDNDGKSDAVLITDSLDFMKGVGDGTFRTTGIYSSVTALGHISGPGEFYNTIRAADFDKDGKLDVIFLATGGVQGGPKPRNFIAFGNGNGTFQNPGVFGNYDPIADADAGGANVITADFNKDGYQDIAIWVYRTGDYAHVLGHIEAYLYNPSGRNFTRSAGYPEMDLGLLALYPGHALAAGDFNNDGKTDLIAHSTASYPDSGTPERLIFFAGNGNGTFATPVSAGYGLPVINDFYAADVNADSLPDLIGAGGNGAWLLLGKGDGSFHSTVFYDAGAGASSVGAADFDGDFRPDLAVGSNNSFVVFPGNGDGTFGSAQKFVVGDPAVYFFETAHLNQDARIDVLVLHHGDADSPITPLINNSGPRADIAVSASRTPSRTETGQAVTHTITITNSGPNVAAGAVASVGLSGNGRVTAIVSSKGVCTVTDDAVCTIGNMAPGTGATIEVTAVPDAVRPLRLTSACQSSTDDPDLVNNGASLFTTVLYALPPSSLRATTVSSGRIDLAWQDNSDVETGYKIERKKGSGAYAQIAALGANANSWSDKGLVPDTAYSYRVKGYRAAGESPYSNEASASTLPRHNLTVTKDGDGSGTVTSLPARIDCGGVCSGKFDQGTQVTLTAASAAGSAFIGWSGGGCTGKAACRVTMNADSAVTANFGRLPNAPSSLAAAAVSSTQIDLSWNDNSGNEGGFAIYRRTTGGTYEWLTSVGPNVTTYSSTNLTPGTTYFYRVASYNAAGFSAKSNEAAAATPARFFFSISKSMLVPSGGKVTSSPAMIDCGPTCWAFVDEGTVLTLTASPEPGSGFGGWSGGGCTGKGKCTVNINANNMVVTASFGPLPSAPTSLSAVALSSSAINLSWNDNSDNETGFRIERKTGPNGTYSLIGTVGAGVTAYSDTGRAPATAYYYRVRAYNSFGNSAYSNAASATTRP